jgi:hypothetical protein
VTIAPTARQAALRLARKVFVSALLLLPAICLAAGIYSKVVSGFRLTHIDAIVLPGEREARVQIKLPHALDRPVRFKYLTQNGTALERIDFLRAEGDLLFLPGETDKLVLVPLLRDLGRESFRLVVDWPQFHPVSPVLSQPLAVDPLEKLSRWESSLITYLVSGRAGASSFSRLAS